MNTSSKFAPTVFVAKSTERYEKGEIITLTSKYGQETDVTVYNFLDEMNGFFYYSFLRAENYEKYIENVVTKSNAYITADREGDEFLILGEPVEVGYSTVEYREGVESGKYPRVHGYTLTHMPVI